MQRAFSFLLCLLCFATANAQTVNGSVKSTGSAQLHVIRLYADSFPKVSLTFDAESSPGNPVWNLQQEDVRVEENGRPGTITKFRLVSQEDHLSTMLVIDHSGSMSRDWRFDEWWKSINPDTLPSDTIRRYYLCNCKAEATTMNPEEAIPCSCGTTGRDTFYLVKRYPYWEYRTPLWYAQQGAKVFLQTMQQKDYAGLVGFSDYPDVEISDAKNDPQTIGQIDNMYAGGATALYDAVDRSLTQLVYHRGLRAVIALTDGQDNSSKMTLEKTIGKAKLMRCPVYVIGLGDVDSIALNKLASETGGELFLTNDATQLEEIFIRISKKLKAVYELVYESPFLKSADSTHELQLRFDVDSMYLRTQLLDLPLPPSAIVHLQQKEKQQMAMLSPDTTAHADSLSAENETVIPAAPTKMGDTSSANEFPYETLGITLLAATAGALVYRKTSRRKKLPALNLISVFPNPTNGPVNINYSASEDAFGLRIAVVNDQGAEVYGQTASPGTQTLMIDLGGMNDGMYFVRLESVSGTSGTERVVVQR